MGHEGHCCHEQRPLIGSPAPSFKARAYFKDWDDTFRQVSLEDYHGQWLYLFFYPLDFTSVCPTEINAYNEYIREFEARHCAVLGCSTDSEHAHRAWVERGDLGDLRYPLLADVTKRISRDYGVLHRERGFAYRGSFLISPDSNVRYCAIHEIGIGRNVGETLRVLDALQSGGMCPANWKKGDKNI